MCEVKVESRTRVEEHGRTVLDETGKKSLWNKDEIRVLNEEGASAVYKTDAMGQASATFTILEEGATFSGNRFMAPQEPSPDVRENL